VELKCVDRLGNEHLAPCINYPKVSGLHVAPLINFQKAPRWNGSVSSWTRSRNYLSGYFVDTTLSFVKRVLRRRDGAGDIVVGVRG